MNISEIFYSIQGEGVLVGTPSVFVRTSGCNLRCRWCDTPYTSWKPEKNVMTNEEIVREIARLHKGSPSLPDVVLTGGEPFLQHGLPDLISLLKEKGYYVTVETNGTRYVSTGADLISISPKMSNSTPDGRVGKRHEECRINYPAVLHFIRNHRYQLKFVVQEEEDLGEIINFLETIGDSGVRIDPRSVLLMPQGRTRDEVLKRYPTVVDMCMSHGFRLSPRLHVDIWGDERGR